MNNPIKLYWSSGLKNGKKNFGDWLSPILCEAVSGRSVNYAKLKHCDLVGVGSLLQRLDNHFWTHRVAVWGSGFIEQQKPHKSIHQIHSTRGKLSAALIKNREVNSFGDPGLLCDILLPEKRPEKRFRTGIIPHYVDQQRPEVTEYCKQSGVRLIDIFSETHSFITQVAQCETILSSSLHGLIVADALNVPNIWIEISDKVRGNRFKFMDYYSVFDINEIAPLQLTLNPEDMFVEKELMTYERKSIDLIKKNIYESFPC